MPSDKQINNGSITSPLTGKRVWVAGEQGLIGHALVDLLKSRGCRVLSQPRHKLDLRERSGVVEWLLNAKPEAIFLTAANVAGMDGLNAVPAEILADTLMVQTTVIDAARRVGVPQLVFFSSAAVYGPDAPVPTSEEAFVQTMPPDTSVYGISKRAGMALCRQCRRQDGLFYKTLIPANVYGPGEPLFGIRSRVVGALVGRMARAMEQGAAQVEIWGDGTATRDFIHARDVAEAAILVAEEGDQDIYNVGSGQETPILNLAEAIKEMVGFNGELVFQADQPAGVPRSYLDTTRLNQLGWTPRLSIEQGLKTFLDRGDGLPVWTDSINPPENKMGQA